MRRLIFGAACSLDGYIAGPDDDVDWLYWSDDVAAISRATLQAVDTVLMGRKTYDVAVRKGTRAYPGVKNYVFSQSLDAEAYPEVEVVREDAAAFVARLVVQPGGDICVMGGGELGRALLAARLIDLALEESRPIAGGCVLLRYRVRKGGAATSA